MVLLELLVRARIDPENLIAPSLRCCQFHLVRSEGRFVPRNSSAKINRLAERGNESEEEQDQSLPKEGALHA